MHRGVSAPLLDLLRQREQHLLHRFPKPTEGVFATWGFMENCLFTWGYDYASSRDVLQLFAPLLTKCRPRSALEARQQREISRGNALNGYPLSKGCRVCPARSRPVVTAVLQ